MNATMNQSSPPVKRFMEEHGLSQRDVAEGSGLWLSQVNGIVRGHTKPTTDTVNRLLGYFRKVDPSVTYDDLFGAERVA